MANEMEDVQWDTLKKEKGPLIVGLWTALWLAVGFVYGSNLGTHAWQVIPIISTFYGVIAGIIFTLIIAYRKSTQSLYSFSASAVFGLAASGCTIPILILLNGKISAVFIFALLAGPVSGMFVSLIYRLVYRVSS